MAASESPNEFIEMISGVRAGSDQAAAKLIHVYGLRFVGSREFVWLTRTFAA